MDSKLLELEMPKAEASVTDRLRYLILLTRRTQAQFSELIGIDASNLSKILSGHSNVSDSFVNRVVVNLGVSKKWLTTGEDVPFPRGEHADVVNSGATAKRASVAGAPVYDVDVAAGAVALRDCFSADRIIGRLDIPEIDPRNPVLHVRGDSMMPRINNGSYLSIREIATDAPIFWGQIYVVMLDDYLLVKYVRRHADADMMILHSANPSYDDMEVRRSDVRRLFIVERILNYDIHA